MLEILILLVSLYLFKDFFSTIITHEVVFVNRFFIKQIEIYRENAILVSSHWSLITSTRHSFRVLKSFTVLKNDLNLKLIYTFLILDKLNSNYTIVRLPLNYRFQAILQNRFLAHKGLLHSQTLFFLMLTYS